MANNIMDNLKNTETWLRGLYMLLFAVLYSIGEIVLVAVILIQFLFTLVTGERNLRLLELGAQLSKYLYQIFMYLSYNGEEKPYPFADWPDDEAVLPESGDEAEEEIVGDIGMARQPAERVEPKVFQQEAAAPDAEAGSEADAASKPESRPPAA